MGDSVLKIFFDSFDDDTFDAAFYQRSFFDVWQKLQEFNIHICSITTDNLPAQVRGWEIFQETIDDPFIKAVFRIPCYAHLINLVFKDAVRLSSWLAQTINSVLTIVKIIRKPEAVNIIGRKCPTISQTRWLYIVDILLFLLSNRVAINDFLQKHSSSSLLIDNDIEFAYRLLILLKTYSLIVEKDHFQLFNIIPLTREFFSELKSLYLCIDKTEWKDVIDIIDCSMRIRILNNSYNETLTAYCLSSPGRAEIREKYKSVRTKCPYTLSLTTPVEKLRDERIKFEHKQTPLYTGEVPFVPSDTPAEEEDEEEDIESVFQKDVLTLADGEEDLSMKINELKNKTFEARIRIDIYQNIYQTAKNELIKTGSIIAVPQEYIEQMFDLFLFEDPLNLQFISYSVNDPYLFWQKVFSFDKDWEVFAELSLRYSCSFATESIVERYLSIQKCVQADKMTNISKPVIKARMQLHQPSKK